MAIFWRKPAPSVAERSRRRITLHLVPLLFFLYILAYIDRSNISVASLGMAAPPEQGGLGLSQELIGVASGLFFWGYWILEIPSTLSVERWGVRWVFVRILVLWGLTAMAMGAIGTPAMSAVFGWWSHDPGVQLKAFRFLLGFFEGGFFPSVIVYLSYWFRTEDRAKAIAGFALAMPLSMAVGNWVSSWLIGVRWFGLAGWRWVFIVEGVLPVLAGVMTFFLLPNRPADATWLTDEEQQMACRSRTAIANANKNCFAHGTAAWQKHVLIVLLLTSVYFFQNITIYGVGFFHVPKIMGTWLPGLPYTVRLWLGRGGQRCRPELLRAQTGITPKRFLAAALPYLVNVVAVLLNARHSDRTGERTWHAAIPLAMLSVGVFLLSQLGSHPGVVRCW